LFYVIQVIGDTKL